MFDPASPKGSCPHCKSYEMEYYGFTFGGLHVYYKCSECRKYTEYRLSLKKFLILNSIILFTMVFTIAAFLSILNINTRLATLALIGAVVLFSMIGYKYRWYLFEEIALKDVQTGLWIIRAPGKKSRLLIIAIFITLLFSYAGIFFLNLIRQ